MVGGPLGGFDSDSTLCHHVGRVHMATISNLTRVPATTANPPTISAMPSIVSIAIQVRANLTQLGWNCRLEVGKPHVLHKWVLPKGQFRQSHSFGGE